MLRRIAVVSLSLVVAACSAGTDDPTAARDQAPSCGTSDPSWCHPACGAGEICGFDGACRPATCQFDADCGVRGACNVAIGACRCPAGTHLCGDRCACDDATASCGARCDPCPAAPLAPGAAVTCEPVTGCSWECPVGQVHCGGGCCNVVSATVGDGHVCAVTDQGGAVCWGSNALGELGDGTVTDRTAPRDVEGRSTGVVEVAAGGDHACARTATGLDCWGANMDGELGLGFADFYPHVGPQAVAGVSGATGLAAATGGVANATCAVDGSGEVWCWGAWLAAATASPTAVGVPAAGHGYGTRTASRVALGADLGAVLRADGTVAFWSLSGASFAAYDVLAPGGAMLTGVVSIAAGSGRGCAATDAGEVYCWTLAAADATSTRLASLSGVTDLAAGRDHFCVVANGGARCWGQNDVGQLGNGNTTASEVPVAVSGLGSGVDRVAAGGYQSCAVLVSGAMWCWGDNPAGVLGVAWWKLPSSSVPVAVSRR